MSLTARSRWKEELVVADEQGREFTFFCGWGVEPPVVGVPSAALWEQRVPEFLRDRRDEALAALCATGHVVEEDDR